MKVYDRLVQIQKEHPELTLDNNGYEYLPRDVKERHKDVIEELEDLLGKSVEGFTEFNNFKPRTNGSIDVRVQYHWDSRFIGVGYFPLSEFKRLEK